MSDSLMYRLTYYNYADASTVMTGQRGYDRVRQARIGLMDFKSAPHLHLLHLHMVAHKFTCACLPHWSHSGLTSWLTQACQHHAISGEIPACSRCLLQLDVAQRQPCISPDILHSTDH